MIENTNIKQFYPGPILNNTLEITKFLFTDNTQIHVTYTTLNADNEPEDRELTYGEDYEVEKVLSSDINAAEAALTASTGLVKLKNLSVKAGEKITVYRETPLIQDMQYPRTGAFPAASHEGALDSIVMQNQEQQEQIQRSLKVPISVSNFTGDMPSPVPGRTLKISADASRFELSDLDVDEAYVSTNQYKTEAQAAKEEATNQANIAITQAGIATTQASAAAVSAQEAADTLANAVTTINSEKNNALTAIDTQEESSVKIVKSQETTSINAIKAQQTTSVNAVKNEGATQINLAKEQATIATNQTNIAKEQATIATSQASIATSKTTEVVESGNTALSNIETAKSSALNDINTTGAEYVNNAEQYAQNALNSATNAKTSEDNALSYKNSAMKSSQTATEQASIAVTNANKAITSATNAKTSETNAKLSETRCEEILSRLGTTIKIKGRVDSLSDLPSSGNLDGDAYLVGEDGLDSYPEYYWYKDHWEFLGTSGTTLSWGLISGNIAAQTDLQTALDSKQNKGNYALKSEIPTKISQLTNDSGFINDDSTFVHKTGNETISGVKTFSSNPVITSTALNINNTNDVSLQKQGTIFIRKASGGQLVLSASNSSIYLRPKGDNVVDKHVEIKTDGTVNATKFVGALQGNAATATKATQDGSGNNIVNTYATKVELNTKANSSLSNLTDAGTQAIKTISQEELNNPFTFGMSQYYKGEMNNISWLKSNGQENSKSVHPDFYNWVLTNANAGKEGFKLSTASNITDYDFVVNPTKETFKLPLKNGQEGVFANGVKGNGITLGFTDGTSNVGLFADNNVGCDFSNTAGFGSNVGTRFTGTFPASMVGKIIGVTTDPSKSGIVVDATVPSGWNLYYYVGETVQNANLIDAGRIEEQLANKVNMLQASGAGMPSSRYIDLTLGASGSTYTAPANGWYCLSKTATATNQFISLQNTTSLISVGGDKSRDSGVVHSYMLPARKGDIIKVSYTFGGTTNKFKFIYAEGEA